MVVDHDVANVNYRGRYEKVTGMSDLGLDETHLLLTTKSGYAWWNVAFPGSGACRKGRYHTHTGRSSFTTSIAS